MSLQRLRKPGVDTKFVIDLGWWDRVGRDFNLYLRSTLCPSCRSEIADETQLKDFDFVDPDTAEVRRVDALWGRVITCCSQQPDFITPTTPLSEAIFRALLAGGNTPLSPREMHERIGKSDPETILRLLSTGHIGYGIVTSR
jgi:hypothetical protein